LLGWTLLAALAVPVAPATAPAAALLIALARGLSLLCLRLCLLRLRLPRGALLLRSLVFRPAAALAPLLLLMAV
jgi:hypothetical protein